MNSSEREQEVTCPACWEPNPANFPVCWSCHADLPEGLEARDSANSVDLEQALRLSVPAATDRRGTLFELVAVGLLLLLPVLLSGLIEVFGPPIPMPEWHVSMELFDMAQRLGAIAIVLVLLRRDGWTQVLGLQRTAWLPEVLWGIGLMVVAVWISDIAYSISYGFALPDGGLPRAYPETGGTFFWFGYPIQFLLVSLEEELLFRVYLWTRLLQLTKRPWLAAWLSALSFAPLHFYSAGGSLSVFGFGMLMSTSFILHRRLWRLLIAHWLFNLLLAWAPVWGFWDEYGYGY